MKQRDSLIYFNTYCERLAVGKRSALGKENSCLDGEVFIGLIDEWRFELDISFICQL